MNFMPCGIFAGGLGWVLALAFVALSTVNSAAIARAIARMALRIFDYLCHFDLDFLWNTIPEEMACESGDV